MANASIRLKSKTRYDIEVNDKGECISFDLSDPQLVLKYSRTIDKLQEIKEKYTNLNYDDLDSTRPEDGNLSQKEKAEAQTMKDFYTEMREAFDTFIGKGGCQKVFGDDNWFTMFDDLLESLMPHFEKMGLTMANLTAEIAHKYTQEDSDVI